MAGSLDILSNGMGIFAQYRTGLHREKYVRVRKKINDQDRVHKPVRRYGKKVKIPRFWLFSSPSASFGDSYTNSYVEKYILAIGEVLRVISLFIFIIVVYVLLCI